MRFARCLSLVLAAMLLPAFAFAQDDGKQAPAPAVQAAEPQPVSVTPKLSVSAIQERIRGIDDLEARKVISPEAAEAERAHYLALAEEATGEKLTRAELDGWTVKQNFIYFTYFLYVVAGVIGVTGLALVFMLLGLPGAVWEVIIYAVCIGLIAIGNVWPAFLGCLGLIGGFTLSLKLHAPKDAKGGPTVLSALCLVAFTVVALLYKSSLIGFMSVAALESLLGFSVLVLPLCIGIGFRDEDAMARGTVASFVLLAAGVAIGLVAKYSPGHEVLPYVMPFQSGLLWLGTFVYFTGMLIISSRWYATKGNFWPLQILTILSGIGAVYLGQVLDVGILSGIGGTFFVIYLLEKYVEVTWKRVHFAWGLVGGALLLGGAAFFANQHPQYFLLGLN